MAAAAPSAGDLPGGRVGTAQRRRRWLVLIVAAVVGIAGFSVFLLVRPPDLAVTEGSTTELIRVNLTEISPGNPLVRYFNATSYANQTGGASSTLRMTIRVYAWFDSPFGNNSFGTLQMYVNVSLVGRFARNVHPNALEMACNGTGLGVHVDAQNSMMWGTNVSFDRNQPLGFVTNGSGRLVATPVNQNGPGAFYEFTFSDEFSIGAYRYYSGFYGFRGTVTGWLLPPIPVGILLGVVASSTGT